MVPTTSEQSPIASDTGRKLFGSLEKIGSAYRGHGFAECRVEWIHHPQFRDAEVAHGTSGGPNVERVAGGDQHHPQIVDFVVRSQALDFTCSALQAPNGTDRGRLAFLNFCEGLG